MRTHSCGELNKKNANEKVTLAGFVDSLRISGKIGFLDIRDRYGKTQAFLNKDLVAEFKSLNREDIIQISGTVQARPEHQVKEPGTGEIELSAESITLLKKVGDLPIDIDGKIQSSEENRMKYRYLDLRKKEMQSAILIRHKLVKSIRDFFDKEKFLEIETPIMAKSTPEGARDYLVPSRTFPGKFFALPQSPQQFKQLLMVAGFDRYFQIARCFRDEDLRADRQPEFTQLDLEMSFVGEEDIYMLMEALMKYVFKDVLDVEVQTPFARMTFDEAMKKYKSDKPDLRKEQGVDYAFLWVTDFPMFEWSETQNRFLAMHHPFTSPNKDDLKYLHDEKQKGKVHSRAYDLVLNGFEIGGGSIRIHEDNIQQEVFSSLGLSEKEVKEQFGFFIDALKFAPPHGGIAFGIDRWAMIMAGRENIREVIAFPKNQEAKDLMLDSPSSVADDQLHELGVFLYEE